MLIKFQCVCCKRTESLSSQRGFLSQDPACRVCFSPLIPRKERAKENVKDSANIPRPKQR